MLMYLNRYGKRFALRSDSQLSKYKCNDDSRISYADKCGDMLR
jgi:lipocalin